MIPAPVVLFVYNRPWHTRQTVEALQKNQYASISDLFVYSDGPQKQEHAVNVREVREYIKNITGFRTVSIIERNENYGLARSIITGVTEIVIKFERVIVLEDDMITSPYFLRFMNEALELYLNEERVISIHGYVYPVSKELPETFFIKGADCWGWSTWKRGWDLFEPNGSKLMAELRARNMENIFNFNGAFDYIRMLRDQIEAKNNSWAVRWYASALLNDKLTLYPGRSLLQNIGNDNSGTHCVATSDFNTILAHEPIRVEPKLPIEDEIALRQFEAFLKSLHIPFYKLVLRSIFRLSFARFFLF